VSPLTKLKRNTNIGEENKLLLFNSVLVPNQFSKIKIFILLLLIVPKGEEFTYWEAQLPFLPLGRFTFRDIIKGKRVKGAVRKAHILCILIPVGP
jgi:hypothetical protein